MNLNRILPALAILAFLTNSAAADRTVTEGFTKVISSQQDNAFTWIVRNMTGELDSERGWDVLVWSIQPEGVPKPIGWTAPEGWTWSPVKGGSFHLIQPSRKYLVDGPSIEPGDELTFSYAINPILIAQMEGGADIQFSAHVGAVSGQSGGRWLSASTSHGVSWFDRSHVELNSPVPEPSSLIAFAIGLVSCMGILWRTRTGDYPGRNG